MQFNCQYKSAEADKPRQEANGVAEANGLLLDLAALSQEQIEAGVWGIPSDQS